MYKHACAFPLKNTKFAEQIPTGCKVITISKIKPEKLECLSKLAEHRQYM